MKKKIAGRILVIEDDSDLQQIYREYLEEAGYEVFHAYVGQQGLNMVKFHKPNLILLDLMLPGQLSGFDVLEKLQRDRETKKIPVIVLTNLDTQEKKVKNGGAVDCLVKTDTTMQEILIKIKQYQKI